jgi:hypothetical protein
MRLIATQMSMMTTTPMSTETTRQTAMLMTTETTTPMLTATTKQTTEKTQTAHHNRLHLNRKSLVRHKRFPCVHS